MTGRPVQCPRVDFSKFSKKQAAKSTWTPPGDGAILVVSRHPAETQDFRPREGPAPLELTLKFASRHPPPRGSRFGAAPILSASAVTRPPLELSLWDGWGYLSVRYWRHEEPEPHRLRERLRRAPPHLAPERLERGDVTFDDPLLPWVVEVRHKDRPSSHDAHSTTLVR